MSDIVETTESQVIQIDDKPHLIWLPTKQPKTFYDGVMMGDPENLIELYSQYQTGDTYKTDCLECDGVGVFDNCNWPMGGPPLINCEDCNKGQIEYKILKPELKQGKDIGHEYIADNFRIGGIDITWFLISELEAQCQK